MRLLYTHQNPMVVELVKSTLEQDGISLLLKNDITSGAAGELAPIDLWPELWVTREHHFERAQSLLERFYQSLEVGKWHCSQCGEENAPTFEVCWQCQHPAPPLKY